MISAVHLKTDGAAAKEQRVTGDDGSHGGAMAGMNGSSPKRRSRALNSRKMGQEGRGAHRGSGAGVHSVRDGI